MGRVITSAVGLRAVVETSVGVPATSGWRVVEFNTIGQFGATLSTTPRRPVSQIRGRKKGSTTDLDSALDFETDLTIDAFTQFAEGYAFSEWANVEFDLRAAGAPPLIDGTPTGYTIDAASAALGGKVQFSGGNYFTLVWAKGYTNAANNGMKPITVDVAPAGTEVTVAGLVTETPPANASLQVAGIRSISDVTLTVALNGTGTLVSAADITNWATLGVFVGMRMHVGGVDTDLTVLNSATIAATPVYGSFRVAAIAGATLTFDKADATLLAGGAGSSSGAETLDILYGRFLRNVPTDANATDNRYLERTYHFEGSYPGLGAGGVTEYEYAVGNGASTLNVNMPLVEQATVGFEFVGTTSDPITATRKAGAASAVAPLRTNGFGTAVNLTSLTTDVVSSVSDVCFKSLTLSILNNLSPEKCLGTLGARFINAGLFEVNLEGQMLFTNAAIVNAVRANTTVTFAAMLLNEDGAIAIDMPSLTLSGGGRDYPTDESVLVNLTGNSFTDPAFGYDVGITVFPMLPIAA